MTGIKRPCLTCGRLIDADSGWNRCELHRKGHDRSRSTASAAARGYDSRHRTLRKRVLKQHLDRHGLTCPGWLVPPHPVNHSSELHLDHVVPLIDGGAADYTNVQILCGRCNRRKGAGSTVAPPREVDRIEQVVTPLPRASWLRVE